MNDTRQVVIVAVDGPAGSGKSSVCAEVAQQLGWDYVNTGAIYRVVGLMLKRRGVDLEDRAATESAVDQIAAELSWDGNRQAMLCAGEDLTEQLNTHAAGVEASRIAKNTAVRAQLLEIQRRLGLQAKRGALVDGRDIGTVIFPDAALKVFMTASPSERAMRRYKQLGEPEDLDVATIQEEIIARDDQDAKRADAPMKKANDAVVFDTTGLDLKDAVVKLRTLLESKNLV